MEKSMIRRPLLLPETCAALSLFPISPPKNGAMVEAWGGKDDDDEPGTDGSLRPVVSKWGEDGRPGLQPSAKPDDQSPPRPSSDLPGEVPVGIAAPAVRQSAAFGSDDAAAAPMAMDSPAGLSSSDLVPRHHVLSENGGNVGASAGERRRGGGRRTFRLGILRRSPERGGRGLRGCRGAAEQVESWREVAAGGSSIEARENATWQDGLLPSSAERAGKGVPRGKALVSNATKAHAASGSGVTKEMMMDRRRQEEDALGDEHVLAAFTVDGLRRVGVCDGALVVVKSLANGIARLAIASALDSAALTQQLGTLPDEMEARHPNGEKQSSTLFGGTMASSPTGSMWFSPEDDVVYLSPMLAFNLQLQLQLQPLVALPSASLCASSSTSMESSMLPFGFGAVSSAPPRSEGKAVQAAGFGKTDNDPMVANGVSDVGKDGRDVVAAGRSLMTQTVAPSFYIDIVPYYPSTVLKPLFPTGNGRDKVLEELSWARGGSSGQQERVSVHVNKCPPYASLVRVACIPMPTVEPALISMLDLLDLVAESDDSVGQSPQDTSRGGGDHQKGQGDPYSKNIDTAICSYFAVDRVLAKGDVFAVPIVHNVTGVLGGRVNSFGSCAWKTERPSESVGTTKITVYLYKVLSLLPSNEPFLRVRKDHSMLMLAGTTTSLLPSGCDDLGHARPSPFIVPGGGIEPSAAREVAMLLAPLLHPLTAPLRMRMSVLLHGPAGVGKRTSTRAAAKRLGVRVVEVNCYSLLRSTDAKMASALTQAFKTAACYSPCVLLLRRFGALGKSSTPGNSSNSAFPTSSQVALALRQAIQAHSQHYNERRDKESRMQEGSSGDAPGNIKYLLRDYTCVDLEHSQLGGDDSFSLEVEEPLRRPSVVVVASVESADGLPVALRRCFTHEIAVKPPDEDERLALLNQYLSKSIANENLTHCDNWDENGLSQGDGHAVVKQENRAPSSCDETFLKTVASQTVGLVARDLRALVADAATFAAERALEQVEDRTIQSDENATGVKNGADINSHEASEHRGKEGNPLHGISCDEDLKITYFHNNKSGGNHKSKERLGKGTDWNKQKKIIGNSTQSGNEEVSRGRRDRQELQVLPEDLDKALARLKIRAASKIGTPKVPNVKWEDVGGLEDVKSAILDTIELPLKHRQLFSSGLRQRSGILLYGPPGTGKTLLAKAVATECSLNFLSVKGPELINMYIGESEKNVREIFEKARQARPCVVFFDELDALAPARGASGDSGGVMDRVVSQMLAEIDGLQGGSQDLFIIGASNRPDLIDPALMRPGRFDKLLYVGVSIDIMQRVRVLEALTNKFKLDLSVELSAIAHRCPANFTGADLYGLCADAWMQAVKRQVECGSENEDYKNKDGDDDVVVKMGDFKKALSNLTPSLSMAELDRYNQLRMQFEGQRSSRRG